MATKTEVKVSPPTLFGGSEVVDYTKTDQWIPKKEGPFGAIKLITERRPITLRDFDNVPYDSFLTNRALSLTKDTVLVASIVNQRPEMDRDMQIAFYLSSIRPRRRYEAWPKQIEDPEIELIAAYYGMSRREAAMHRNIHTTEQCIAMQKAIDERGGRLSRKL